MKPREIKFVLLDDQHSVRSGRAALLDFGRRNLRIVISIALLSLIAIPALIGNFGGQGSFAPPTDATQDALVIADVAALSATFAWQSPRTGLEDSQSSTSGPQSVTFQNESVSVITVSDLSLIPADVREDAIILGGPPRESAGLSADLTGSGSKRAYIICGDVDISAGPIIHQDFGHAYITQVDGTIIHMEMGLESNSPRGPPQTDSGNPNFVRPIYIVGGEVRSFTGPDQLHESFMHTRVLDLHRRPSEFEPLETTSRSQTRDDGLGRSNHIVPRGDRRKENPDDPFGRIEHGPHRQPGLERPKPIEKPRYEARRPRVAP